MIRINTSRHPEALNSDTRFLAACSINLLTDWQHMFVFFKDNHKSRFVPHGNTGGYNHLDLTVRLASFLEKPSSLTRWLKCSTASSSLSKQCAFWLQELELHFGQHWLVGGGSGWASVSCRHMIGYTCSNYCKAFYAAFEANGKEGAYCKS